MKFEMFRPKSNKDLENQAQKAEEILGEKILPHNASSVEDLDISNIKTEYKTRYDAYVQALRAEKKRELDIKEIQHAKEWVKALNNLDNYIKDHESKDDPLLREKQFVVFKKIRDFLEKGKRKGYVKLPTGTGKTILFSKTAEALDMKTFIASPSRIILDQNAEETEEFTDSEYGKYYGLEKDLSKKVTHITYHSLVNAVRDDIINPDDIPVLILDEAHEALGPERAKTVSKFNGLELGFTATSEFSEDKKLSELLPEEIFRMDVADGIREGLICQTQTIHAYTNVDLASVGIKNGEFDSNELEKVVNIHGRNMAALELYKNKFSPLKAICNCSGVKHAQDVAQLFNEQGIPAACIIGTTTKDERKDILAAYKAGTIKVLTNAQVLLQGFNEPSCSVTFNLHPTLSIVDAEQRARSGRLDKNNPDKWNYVVDFIDQNAVKPQVLYSEILEGDKVWDISNIENNNAENHTNASRQASEPTLPINLSDFSLDGLKVVVDTKSIMEITNSNIDFREKYENIPNKKEGWESIQVLCDQIKVSPIKMKASAEKYRVEHPEWFEMQRKRNFILEHYSPELIAILKIELGNHAKGEGWISYGDLSRYLKKDKKTIIRFAEKYRVEHPEWFEMRRSYGKVMEHYSPELISIIKRELKVVIDKKEGWENANILRINFKSTTNKIKSSAEKYRAEHPEWFEMQLNKNRTSEHYSPELTAILEQEFTEVLGKKEGWENSRSLSSEEIKASTYTINDSAEKYRAEHPEWFEMQKNYGKVTEHYSPELIEQLKKDLNK